MGKEAIGQISLSRRDVLKTSAGVAAAVLLGACGVTNKDSATPLPTASATATEIPTPSATIASPEIPKNVSIELGSEEDVLPLGIFGLKYFPDGHSGITPEGDGIALFISAAKSSYKLVGKEIPSLQPHAIDAQGNAIPVLEGDPNDSFGKDYRGLTTVLPIQNSDKRIGFFHGENHLFRPNGVTAFRASIGVVSSEDKGNTWQNAVEIIRGRNEAALEDTPDATGAGQPSFLIVNQYLHAYYNDWSRGDKRDILPDTIHMARAPIANNAFRDPNKWEKLTKQGFKADGPEGDSKPLFLPNNQDIFLAFPSVSFNTYLKRYIMTYRSDTHFYFRTSQDAIQWGDPNVLLQLPQRESTAALTDVVNRYPSFLSPQLKTDQITEKQGVLLYATGKKNSAHHMVARKYTIE